MQVPTLSQHAEEECKDGVGGSVGFYTLQPRPRIMCVSVSRAMWHTVVSGLIHLGEYLY